MAWTSPRTWVAGETLTAALLNLHVRDNLKAIGDPWTAWTPTVTASSGTFTTVSGAGRYVAAGKLIHFEATVTITTPGTASGDVLITIPVTARASGPACGAGRSSAAGAAVVSFLSSTTQCTITRFDGAAIASGAGTVIVFGTYEAA